MARPPGTGQPFASPLGMAELFVRLLWCRAPCWGGPIRAVAVLGPVRGPARASLRPLHPRLGHRLPASTASQLVAIRVCLGLSHRICTPALALRPGEAVLVVFRSGAAQEENSHFPTKPLTVTWPGPAPVPWCGHTGAVPPPPAPHPTSLLSPSHPQGRAQARHTPGTARHLPVCHGDPPPPMVVGPV